MRYQDAITDRNALDITNKTSKAYFNVADWLRVYYNALNASNLSRIVQASELEFNPVRTHPLITSFPSVEDFNTLLANIERNRLEALVYAIPGTLTEIKDDWQAGINQAAPTYVDANLWETVASAIYLNIAAAEGFTSWVSPTDPGTRRHRTNVGICGADLTRNNGFVRY